MYVGELSWPFNFMIRGLLSLGPPEKVPGKNLEKKERKKESPSHSSMKSHAVTVCEPKVSHCWDTGCNWQTLHVIIRPFCPAQKGATQYPCQLSPPIPAKAVRAERFTIYNSDAGFDRYNCICALSMVVVLAYKCILAANRCCVNTFPVQGCKRDLTSGKATMSDIGYGKNRSRKKKQGPPPPGFMSSNQKKISFNLMARQLNP